MGEIQIKNIDGVAIFRHTAKNNSVKITLEEAIYINEIYMSRNSRVFTTNAVERKAQVYDLHE